MIRKPFIHRILFHLRHWAIWRCSMSFYQLSAQASSFHEQSGFITQRKIIWAYRIFQRMSLFSTLESIYLISSWVTEKSIKQFPPFLRRSFLFVMLLCLMRKNLSLFCKIFRLEIIKFERIYTIFIKIYISMYLSNHEKSRVFNTKMTV